MRGWIAEGLALFVIVAVPFFASMLARRFAVWRASSEVESLVPIPWSFELRLLLPRAALTALLTIAIARILDGDGSFEDYLWWWTRFIGLLMAALLVKKLGATREWERNVRAFEPGATPAAQDEFEFERFASLAVALPLLLIGFFIVGGIGLRPLKINVERATFGGIAFGAPAGWVVEPATSDRRDYYYAGTLLPASLTVERASSLAVPLDIGPVGGVTFLSETRLEVEGAKVAVRKSGTAFTSFQEKLRFELLVLIVPDDTTYALAVWGEPGDGDDLEAIADELWPTVEVIRAPVQAPPLGRRSSRS